MSNSHSVGQPAWYDLERKLDELLSNPHSKGEAWAKFWQALVEHDWFKAELAFAARKSLDEAGLPESWNEDVAQDATLIMLRKFQPDRELHADLKRLELQFGGWMAQIIENSCRDAVRKTGRLYTRTDGLSDLEPVDERSLLREERAELLDAIGQLSQLQRRIINLYRSKISLKEIGRIVRVSYSTVLREKNKAIQQLRNRMRDI